jgi:hypothetical protein
MERFDMKADELYTPQEILWVTSIVDSTKRLAAEAPLILTKSALCLVVLISVFFLEMHIVYMLFDYISSGDSDAWSPWLFSLTGAVMIIGFHVLADRYPSNFAVRFVDRVTQYLIPTYLVGVGLIVAGIVGSSGLFELLDVHDEFSLDPNAFAGANWVELVLTNINNPLAVLCFSLGIGGLAIVNIFVAHDMLHKIREGLGERFIRLQNAKRVEADLKIINAGMESHTNEQFNYADLEIMTDEFVADERASHALGIVSDEMAGFQEAITNGELEAPSIESRFLIESKPDIAQIKARIKKIESLDHAKVKSLMLSN